MSFKTANTDWNALCFHFSQLSAILAKLSVTWYKRVDWTPFIFLVCCPFVPPFSSVCCATQQPLYCIFTLTTNLRRPLWVNRWFQPYLVLHNEQLESKQSQVKTYPSIQVSNSKLTNIWSKENEYFRILSARTDTYLHELFCKTPPFCVREYPSMGAQWLSGRVLDSRPKGRGFEPHRRHCVVSLSKTHLS